MRITTVGLVTLAVTFANLIAADEPPVANRVRDAITKGLPLVQQAAKRYPSNRDCFSCHHQTLPMLAMYEARDAGLPIDEEILKGQTEFTRKFLHDREQKMRDGINIGGSSMTVGYGLWALELGGHEQDSTTDAGIQYLLKKQEKDGHWTRLTARPPLGDSHVMVTVLAAYGMRRFLPVEQEDEVNAAVRRGLKWLTEVTPESQEDRNAKLWGLDLLCGEKSQIEAAREDVLAAQKPDGGFSQIPTMESDAYATGQALFVLVKTGLPASDARVLKGVEFLLKSQLEDGSWFVKSRSRPIQTMFDNGDPHGTDQFISTAASSWALAALAVSGNIPAPKK